MVHLLFTILFALATGIVLGMMLRRRPADAVRLALWITVSLVACALLMGWVLYFLPTG